VNVNGFGDWEDLGGGITAADVDLVNNYDAAGNAIGSGFDFGSDFLTPLFKAGLSFGTSYATAALLGNKSGQQQQQQRPNYANYLAPNGATVATPGGNALTGSHALTSAATTAAIDYTPYIVAGIGALILLVVLK